MPSTRGVSSLPVPLEKDLSHTNGSSRSNGANDSNTANGSSTRNSKTRTRDRKNTSRINVNDFVYLETESPSDPYYIARIMEFVSKDQLRVNWFNRSRDLKHKNPRMLFASMASDIVPTESIAGKCKVMHKSEWLKSYTSAPDTFFYEKFYDRNLMKYFNVLPVKDITNLPPIVLQTLKPNWKYIIVEAAREKELKLPLRICNVCEQWCAVIESEQCGSCGLVWHLACARPKLSKTTGRGFGWNCSACVAKIIQAKASSHTITSTRTNGTNGASNTNDENKSDVENDNTESISDDKDIIDNESVLSENESEEYLCQHKLASLTAPPHPTEVQKYHISLYPYRYLGIYINPYSALDFDVAFYPVSGTRIGMKYQWTDEDSPEVREETRFADSRSSQLLSDPINVNSADVNKFLEDLKMSKAVDFLELDFLDKAIQTLNETNNLEEAKKLLLQKTSKDKRLLSEQEIVRIERSFPEHGKNLHPLAKASKIPVSKLVRNWYIWRKTERGQQARKASTNLQSETQMIKNPKCQNCGNPCEKLYCDLCGEEWYRYATKRVVENLKKRKVSKADMVEVVIEEPVAKKAARKSPAPPCRICQASSSSKSILCCSSCKLIVHQECYGSFPLNNADWICDVCQEAKRPTASAGQQCALCPVTNSHAADFDSPTSEPLKKSVENNWVHVQCSMWTPECRFEDHKRFKRVEGMNSIPANRWSMLCAECKIAKGACITCHICRAPVHVTCAILSGYTMGFDISPVKMSRKSLIKTIKFNGESGVMSAAVWCRNHDPKQIIFHKLMDKSNVSADFAIQLFSRTYKQSDTTINPTLRRHNYLTLAIKSLEKSHIKTEMDKESRRSSTTPASTFKEENELQKSTECSNCKIQTSPFWWQISDSTFCQICYYDKDNEQQTLKMEDTPKVIESLENAEDTISQLTTPTQAAPENKT